MTIQLKKRPTSFLLQANDLAGIKDSADSAGWHEFSVAGKIIGAGYLGVQNKGVGWLIPNAQQKPDATFFTNLFLEAIGKRKFLVRDAQTTAFRLFNGAGDGFGGLTIDYYGGYAVFSWYNETIANWKKEIIRGFKEAFASSFREELVGIVAKNRYQGAASESEILDGTIPEDVIVLENGLKYHVHLQDGWMTGIFLDQREVRKSLKEGLAKDCRVLNTFSYTGAFSVAAKVGGAKSTTSVDLAKRSLPLTKEQFEVNELDDSKEKMYAMDVFHFFDYAAKKKLNYDCIILDPPSFARNKKQTFSVAKNYNELIEASLKVMKKGLLICSTNASNISYGNFRKMIETTLKDQKQAYAIQEVFRLPADFPAPKEMPEENYLKVVVVSIL